jgi:hypothetical protein
MDNQWHSQWISMVFDEKEGKRVRNPEKFNLKKGS